MLYLIVLEYYRDPLPKVHGAAELYLSSKASIWAVWVLWSSSSQPVIPSVACGVTTIAEPKGQTPGSSNPGPVVMTSDSAL